MQNWLDTRRSENSAVAESNLDCQGKIRAKIRFDYRGTPRPPRFIFGGKGSKDVAEELRDQQAAMWRNVPLQGTQVDGIEYLDIYTVFERSEEADISYAPIELLVQFDSIEDCLRFVCCEEFKRLQIISPNYINLSSRELERVLFKISETFQQKLLERDAGNS